MKLFRRSCAVVDVGAVDKVGCAARGGIAWGRAGESKAGLLGVKLGAIGLIGIARGGDGRAVATAGRMGDIGALTYIIGEENILCSGRKLPWIPDNFIFLVLINVDIPV